MRIIVRVGIAGSSVVFVVFGVTVLVVVFLGGQVGFFVVVGVGVTVTTPVGSKITVRVTVSPPSGYTMTRRVGEPRVNSSGGTAAGCGRANTGKMKTAREARAAKDFMFGNVSG